MRGVLGNDVILPRMRRNTRLLLEASPYHGTLTLVNVTSPTAEWPDSLLRDHGQMTNVRDDAQALKLRAELVDRDQHPAPTDH